MLIACCPLLAAGCMATDHADAPERPARTRPGPTGVNPGETLPPSVSQRVILNVQPWSFGEQAGQVVRTPHYAIHTTERSPAIAERMPGFMEVALAHYRSALVALPEPPRVMNTFVMNDRRQWQTLVRQTLGPSGEPATAIRRGGLTYKGQAMLFDIGAGDTLAIAAHEGWHQYSQSSFGEMMPVWLEEGVATYMEGHRWTGRDATFMPWANLARYDRLRVALQKGEARSLEDVLTNSPGSMIGIDGPRPVTPEMLDQPVPSQDAPVVWYCQVWALMHFLAEGEGGKYRSAFERAIADASAGRMSQFVATRLGQAGGRRGVGPAYSLAVFRAYFASDLAAVDAEYGRFVNRLAANGVRSDIVAGRSPFGTGAAAPTNSRAGFLRPADGAPSGHSQPDAR